jgi:hypothetical protein
MPFLLNLIIYMGSKESLPHNFIIFKPEATIAAFVLPPVPPIVACKRYGFAVLT